MRENMKPQGYGSLEQRYRPQLPHSIEPRAKAAPPLPPPASPPRRVEGYSLSRKN